MNREPRPSRPAVCTYCRHLQISPEAEDALAPDAWCRLWQIIIPEPATTGCTEFSARAAEEDKVTR